jgi:hypothetical protein
VANATDQGHFVDFESHPRASAKAKAAACELILNLLGGYPKAGRQTLDDDNEGLTVGFTGGEEAKHASILREGGATAGTQLA